VFFAQCQLCIKVADLIPYAIALVWSPDNGSLRIETCCNVYYYYYYYYYYYLLQLCCHSLAVVLTLVQTKQISINIYKRNNTKTQYTQYTAHYIQVHLLPKYPHNCQNTHHIHTPTHYKTSSNNLSKIYTTNEILTIQSIILGIRSP